MDSRCRLCCHADNILIGIFDETGLKNKLNEKINNRLHILVDEKDMLPKAVCILCYGKLEKFDLFMKNSQKAQGRLLSIVQDELKSSLSSKNNDRNCEVCDTVDLDEPINLISDESDEDGDYDIQMIGIEDLKPSPRFDQKPSTSYIDSAVTNTGKTSSMPNGFANIFPSIYDHTYHNPAMSPANITDKTSANGTNVKQKFSVEPLQSCSIRMKQDAEVQAGNTLLDDNRYMEEHFFQKHPTADSNNILLVTSRIQGKGTCISSNRHTDKGGQVLITFRLKPSNNESTVGKSRSGWNKQQKRAMLNYFQGSMHDSNFIPTLEECSKFLKDAGSIFDNKFEENVRMFFRNRRRRYVASNRFIYL